jgi:hypothetical protein
VKWYLEVLFLGILVVTLACMLYQMNLGLYR